MAQQKIQAGKTIDALTRKELDDALGTHLRSWVAEIAQGGRYPRFAEQGTVTAGVLSIGGHVGQYALGPQAGFVWDVRRLRITGLGVGDAVGVYINEPAPTQLIASTTDLSDGQGTRVFYWNQHVVLYPGETLKIYGTGLASTGTITVSGQVLELPIGLAWKLT